MKLNLSNSKINRRSYLAVLLSVAVLSLCLSQSTVFAIGLKYSSYLGGTDEDSGWAVTVDSSKCAYVAGNTWSTNFPARNAYQPVHAGGYQDAFVSKFSSTGSSLVYSTYLGGSYRDLAYGIAVDSSKSPYVTGKTTSGDFPIRNAYQSTKRDDYDVFITKLSSSGTTILYSSFLGGSRTDHGYAISLDSNKCAYLTGRSESYNFPTVNPYQASNSGHAAFVTKFSSTGSNLIYSTYLGGNHSAEEGYAIAVDSGGYAYVTGYTLSTDFPTRFPYQASRAGWEDAFVTCLSYTGSSLIFSTYLGGADYDRGQGIALDSANRAIVTGWTGSTNFPTYSAYQSSLLGSKDAFLTKLHPGGGSSIVFSTYLGGSSSDEAHGIALDSQASIYLTGYTYSSNFPTRLPYQSTLNTFPDVFLTKFYSSGSSLSYSTYLGGNDDDYGEGVAVDSFGDAYITGYTKSTNFPTTSAYQQSRNGGTGDQDAFLSKLGWPVFHALPSLVLDSGDYNGDGVSDIAIFRASAGLWAVRGITRVYFGSSSDNPAPGDYNGDGTTDIGVYRRSSGLWAIRNVTRFYLGSSSALPYPGDYDGDGTCDGAIFRYTNGLWAARGVTRLYYGAAYDQPAPGDYDGDGTKEIAVFRRSAGLWAIRGVSRIYYGGAGDSVASGDYNGDGAWEPAIFRGTSGLWASRGVTRLYFGSAGDYPRPANYGGSAADDPGIFRSSAGLWAARGITRVYFGAAGDVPVTR